MASLEKRTRSWNVVFRFGGRKFTRSLGTGLKSEAEARVARLEENIRLVESGRLAIPEDADVATFLLSDGKLDHKIELDRPTTLAELFEAFFAALPEGNLEAKTIETLRLHVKHANRLIGGRRPANQVTQADLQDYIAARSKEPGQRGRTISAVTIKKEIASIGSMWNWGLNHSLLERPYPRRGLRYPKTRELPPFQTYDQITRRIEKGGLTAAEERDLWDCLFLSVEEIDEVLDHVRQSRRNPVVYPMFATAAHTGARRSELLRSKLHDITDDELVIHERKRDASQHTTRRVPLSPRLRRTLDEWIAIHPGGEHTFCLTSHVTNTDAQHDGPRPVTPDAANDLFRRALRGGKWSEIRGWHCFRHSFISNLARRGIDQRLIDSYTGHSTEVMRRRYTHLFPDARQQTLSKVFGGY
ncbi:MAG: site-specific integrase [Planctomycetota bacterium]